MAHDLRRDAANITERNLWPEQHFLASDGPTTAAGRAKLSMNIPDLQTVPHVLFTGQQFDYSLQ